MEGKLGLWKVGFGGFYFAALALDEGTNNTTGLGDYEMGLVVTQRGKGIATVGACYDTLCHSEE